MNNYAEQIKRSVTMRQVCELYGLEVNRAGFCKCPFHNERTASMKVYDGNRGYCCFSCGESGDTINFVMKFFGIKFNEALAKINENFNLGLPIGRDQTEAERQEAIRAERERKRRRDAERRELSALTAEYEKTLDRYARLDLQCVRGRERCRSDGVITDEFAEALKNIDQAKAEYAAAEVKVRDYENRNRGST